MRVTLNNTAIFLGQAREMRVALLLATVICASGACRHKKPPASQSKSTAASDFAPVRPPPPPAETPPAPADVPPPARRGGSLRVHLDGEPSTLLPLAEDNAATAQITSGLIYETLLDCRDGTYKPALAERWHDHRVFGVMDVQATVEPLLRNGSDAPVLRAELADVAAIELVTERTVRFVLKRPSDLALRALCDV